MAGYIIVFWQLDFIIAAGIPNVKSTLWGFAVLRDPNIALIARTLSRKDPDNVPLLSSTPRVCIVRGLGVQWRFNEFL